MPQRYKYPEATGRRNHYRSVVSRLTRYRDNIVTGLSGAESINAGALESSNLQGEYYEVYNTKKDDWLLQHREIITSFDSFMSSLDSCIQNAHSLELLWESRIAIMEEY